MDVCWFCSNIWTFRAMNKKRSNSDHLAQTDDLFSSNEINVFKYPKLVSEEEKSEKVG